MNTAIVSNDVANDGVNGDVFTINHQTSVDRLAEIIPLEDTRSISEAFQIVKWDMELTLHTDGDYREVVIPTDDASVDLLLIRKQDEDWIVDVDRSGGKHLSLAEVSAFADTLNHAVFLANELNGVNK